MHVLSGTSRYSLWQDLTFIPLWSKGGLWTCELGVWRWWNYIIQMYLHMHPQLQEKRNSYYVWQQASLYMCTQVYVAYFTLCCQAHRYVSISHHDGVFLSLAPLDFFFKLRGSADPDVFSEAAACREQRWCVTEETLSNTASCCQHYQANKPWSYAGFHNSISCWKEEKLIPKPTMHLCTVKHNFTIGSGKYSTRCKTYPMCRKDKSSKKDMLCSQVWVY